MYDTIIIGGGPAGYLAAERLGSFRQPGQAQKKVVLIEEQHLGGTCLNMGCIPTKTLLNSAKLYVHARESHKFGIQTQGVSFDWQAVQSWKAEVVSKLCAGIAGKMKRCGVEVINGRGEILDPPLGGKPARVRSRMPDGTDTVHEAAHILICAGSVPIMPPIPGAADNPLVLDSTGLLAVENVPGRLAIIGGGVIGVEFAGLFSALGSQVTVIEMMDEIVPFMDREQAPILRRSMTDVHFMLGSTVTSIDKGKVNCTSKDGKAVSVEADLILMAVGRKPVLDTWGANHIAGIDVTPKGIVVDDRMRTNIPGIWAAGDVTGKSLLAHCAYRMGEVAVADMLGNNDRMRYNAIPWAVYGITEAAGVGITEQEAAARGIAVLKASLPMQFSGRFVAENTFGGIGAVKVIADASDRRILGIHAVGPYSPEYIWGGAAIIEQEMRIDDVKEIIFPHPTVSELIRDVVWELT